MDVEQQIERRIKLRDLRILRTVVEAGSMGKASESLSVSQPAVSKAIAALERSLGVRLLDRTPQGVEPTNYGRVLVDCGVAVFDDLRQGLKQIELLSDPTGGNFGLAVPDRSPARSY